MKTGPLDSDPVRKSPEIERKREWAHGDGGLGESCGRKNKPIYTDPQAAPRICRGYSCDNEEWYSRGHVLRDKGTKKILVKETPDGKRIKVD